MTPADQAQLAANWATILQSEWAGLAADREVHDTLHRAASRLAQQAALLDAHPPAGPAPADASPTPAGVSPAPEGASPTPAGVSPAPEGASPTPAGVPNDPSRLAGTDAPPGSAAVDAALGAAGAAFPASRADGNAPAGGSGPGLG